MDMVRMVVKKNKIKHKDLDGNIVYIYPGEEIILSTTDAEKLKDNLLDAGDQKNISKIAEEIASGETISMFKHKHEIDRMKKERERDFLELAEQKNKKIEGLETYIQSLETQIVSLNAEIKEVKVSADPARTKAMKDDYDKQLLSYEKIIEEQNKKLDKQDKEIEKLTKSLNSKK